MLSGGCATTKDNHTLHVKALPRFFFFSVFGLPKTIQTDQGSNFKSGVFKRVVQALNIVPSTSGAYHPESQGAPVKVAPNFETQLLFASRKFLGWEHLICAICSSWNCTGITRVQPSWTSVWTHSSWSSPSFKREVSTEPITKIMHVFVRDIQDHLWWANKIAKDFLVSSQNKMKRQMTLVLLNVNSSPVIRTLL